MNEEHERIMERIMVGDLDDDADEVRALLREHPELAERLERLRGLAGRLDAAGATARRRFEQAVAEPQAIEADVERRVLAELRRPRRRARWPWVAAAAAAVLLSAAWLLWGVGAERGDRGNMILGTEGELHPNAEQPVEAFDELRWDLGYDVGYRFHVRVFPDAEKSRLIDDAVVEDATFWRPDIASTARWPRRIYWTVDVLNANDVSVGSYGTWAERR